jgi:hypothetical protein
MTNVHPDPVVDDDIEHTDEGASRRAWLKNVAIGAAGATAGAMAFGKSASADDPNDVTLGATKTATAPTIIDYEGAAITEGPSVFSAGEEVPAADAPFPAAVGGYGGDDVANGVHGSTTNGAGHGVVAANLAAAAATDTDPAPLALGVAAPNGAHIHLIPSAVSGPTAGTHVPGELYVDLDGTLWFSVATATAGEVAWVKLAAAGQQASAGAFFAINPARSYDSRKTSYTVNGPLAPNQDREISVADDHHRDTGAVTTANVVPVGATAVMVNITVSSPTDKNYFAVTAGDVMTTATSVQNWDAGVTQIANAVTVPLSPTRTIRVYMGDQAGSADIVVDVFGYYL